MAIISIARPVANVDSTLIFDVCLPYSVPIFNGSVCRIELNQQQLRFLWSLQKRSEGPAGAVHHKDGLSGALHEVLSAGLSSMAMYNPHTKLPCPYYGFREVFLGRILELDNHFYFDDDRAKSMLKMPDPQGPALKVNYAITTALYFCYEYVVAHEPGVEHTFESIMARVIDAGMLAIQRKDAREM